MIPSYFKIEILAIQDEFVLLGHKGLTCLEAFLDVTHFRIFVRQFVSGDLLACICHILPTFLNSNWKHMFIWYEGYSKSSKTNSKKYFIYEIDKIIFLHSFHPIHNNSVRDVSIEKFRPWIFRCKHRLRYELDGNYVEK